jgi:hypothetical protein
MSNNSRRIIYGEKTVDDFIPPPLNDPVVPESIAVRTSSSNGTSNVEHRNTQELYIILQEARTQIDTPEGESRFRAVMQQNPDMARAVYQVLLESRKIISNDNNMNTIVEPPPMNRNDVQLPVGFKSWLQLPKQQSSNSNNLFAGSAPVMTNVGRTAAIIIPQMNNNNNNTNQSGGFFAAQQMKQQSMNAQQYQQQQQFGNNNQSVKCYNCQGFGHYSRNCPLPPQQRRQQPQQQQPQQ